MSGDTSDWADSLFRDLLMRRTGSARLQMACEMFDGAIELVSASLPAAVAADPVARRLAVIERMYWGERRDPCLRRAFEAFSEDAHARQAR